MFTPPAQPSAVAYPFRVKRKPVPSLDFDFPLGTESKQPICYSGAASIRNAGDSTYDLPRLSYIDNREPEPLYSLQSAVCRSGPPRVINHIKPSWLHGHTKHHSLDITPATCVKPHYHRRTRSTPAIPFQVSNPNVTPPAYIYPKAQVDLTQSKIAFPTPVLEFNISSLDMDTNDSLTSGSSSQADSSHVSLPSLSFSTQSPSDSPPASPATPKDQMLGRFLRPLRKSSIMGRKDDPPSENRRRKISLLPLSSPIGLQPRASGSTPSLPLPRAKRNVLKSPRRPNRSMTSMNAAATLKDNAPLTPFQLRVDTELGYLSQQKDMAPHIASQSVIDSPLKHSTLPVRPRTSSGPGSRTFSFSNPQQPRRLKRPSTAPAAAVTSAEENRSLTLTQLAEAASLFVVAESGVRVPFGDLFLGRKTVVIFIRHFWCPYCQDYMFSISDTVSPTTLNQAGVDLVVISNGSHNMIQSYRKIFRTPFAVYTDPTHLLFKTLGMICRTLDPGPESTKGAYVKHGIISGIAMVVANAIKTKMPVWEQGGDIEQLGGEFVLGPGLKCTYAHRMSTTRSHMPIQRVLAAAGVDLYARWEGSGQVYSTMSEAEQAKWMVARNHSLEKLRDKKFFRRVGETLCGVSTACEGEDYDESREEDRQTVGSITTIPGLTDNMSASTDTSDARSFSGSILYREYYSGTDET